MAKDRPKGGLLLLMLLLLLLQPTHIDDTEPAEVNENSIHRRPLGGVHGDGALNAIQRSSDINSRPVQSLNHSPSILTIHRPICLSICPPVSRDM